MPFIAVDPVDNHPRIPIGVGDDEEVRCPVCGDLLRVRDGSAIARHFYHPPDSDCSGESPLHLRMKSIAVDKLQAAYPDATVHVEFVTEEVPRRADVFVEFAQPNFPLGKGLAVEVQYRNEQKNFTRTTASYLVGETSVIWLFEENYVGTYPEYEDVNLPEPVPVWPYSVPHGEATSSEPSAEDYLGITEGDLVAALPNHVDGQVPLAEFPTESDTAEDSDGLPGWSREKELQLNVSVECPGVRQIYRSWIAGRVQYITNQHQDDIEYRRSIVESENRATYFSHRFIEASGNAFEFSIEVHPSNDGQFIIRHFVEGTEREIRSPTKDSIVKSFTEFVMDLCYELQWVRTPTQKSRELTQPVTSQLGTFSYSISPTGNETVIAELRDGDETVNLEFRQQHIQALLELCAKVRLWYEYPDMSSG